MLNAVRKCISESIILSYQEEEVISVCDNMEKSYTSDKVAKGLIDKYWTNRLKYIIDLKEEKDNYNPLLVICKCEINKKVTELRGIDNFSRQ